MDRYLWLRLAAILTLLLSAPAAFAQDSTEQTPADCGAIRQAVTR